MSDQGPASAIEVGASSSSGDLRYWRAKEAVRQGELRLAEQAAIRTALEARATAITGWGAASLLAITAASFTSNHWVAQAAGLTAAAVLFGAAVTGIYSARPRDWAMRGYDPSVILDDDGLATELEVLESIAKGYSPGIQANNVRINITGRMLRGAGGLLIGAPFVGALTYILLLLLT